MLNKALCCGYVQRSGDIAPYILDLGTRWSEWLA